MFLKNLAKIFAALTIIILIVSVVVWSSFCNDLDALLSEIDGRDSAWFELLATWLVFMAIMTVVFETIPYVVILWIAYGIIALIYYIVQKNNKKQQVSRTQEAIEEEKAS